jgi:hypothetical protein
MAVLYFGLIAILLVGMRGTYNMLEDLAIHSRSQPIMQ